VRRDAGGGGGNGAGRSAGGDAEDGREDGAVGDTGGYERRLTGVASVRRS